MIPLSSPRVDSIMHRPSVPTRLAMCLAGMTIIVLLFARSAGLLPDDQPAVLRGRTRLCETMAVYFSLMAGKDNIDAMQTSLDAFARKNPQIRSLVIRRARDEKILAQAGDRVPATKKPSHSGDSPKSLLRVPIWDGETKWGRLDVTFFPANRAGWWATPTGRFTWLIGFVVLGIAATFYLYLQNLLRQLNPQKVMSARVKLALDTLAEGLLILDDAGRITLSNAVFAKMIGEEPGRLKGRRVEELPWEAHRKLGKPEPWPWRAALEEGIPTLGGVVHFTRDSGGRRTFVVNTTPILDQAGKNWGALISFKDVSQGEKNKRELRGMLANLRKSSDEVRRQNRELEHLATRDPLTSCHNRRSFFERFNSLWNSARRNGHALACVMLDIDHFKPINDNHGHSVGDEVLKGVGQILNQSARESDIVCRYGGEEFAILLAYSDIEEAAQAAERFRLGFERTQFSGLSITASLGVSAIEFGAGNPQGLLDQADKSLYLAKRNGRNRVVRWDEVPEDFEVENVRPCRSGPLDDDGRAKIPFQAITALISALAYRDVATAEHSRRVADLCVATGEGLMSLASCYVLENAALLHDIGKIGVPDSILLKPQALTEEEWEVMRRQERIGVEIIRASFDSQELVEIVAHHRTWFGGTPHAPHLPKGEDIPLGARILHIINAYDAMTSHQVYREPCTPEEAFKELRKFAGTQFDPALVERFFGIMKDRRSVSPPDVSRVSQETALQFGLQIESLMAALDKQDVAGLRALADRLHAVAEKHRVREIAEKASQLAGHSKQDFEVAEVLHTANELIELCRSTQSSYIRLTSESSTA